MARFFLSFLVFGLLSFSVESRPKVGLSLSGGVGRGIAHIGIIKRLQEERIPVDVVTGTSIGAIIGALYAVGYSHEEIQDLFESTDWREILFSDQSSREKIFYQNKVHQGRYIFNFEAGLGMGGVKLPRSFVKTQRLNLVFRDWFLHVSNTTDFSKLPLSFQCVATNLETGKAEYLKSGDLVSAIRSSSAYPGIFSPVERESKILVDGGPSTNLPVRLAKQMGAKFVIGVDTSEELIEREELENFLNNYDQTVTILLRKETEKELGEANIAVSPPLGGMRMFDGDDLSPIIEAGYKSLDAHIVELRKLSLSESEYRRYESNRRRKLESFELPVVSRVEFVGSGAEDAGFLRSLIKSHSGGRLHQKDLARDIEKIYGTSSYEFVDYQLVYEDEESILRIHPRRKAWGPHFLRFGLTWDGELKGEQDFNAIVNFQMTDLNRLGASWLHDFELGTRLTYFSEFMQPLERTRLLFLAIKFRAQRADMDIYSEGDRQALYELDQLDAGIDLGLHLSHFAELRVGLRKRWLNSDLELGTGVVPNFREAPGYMSSRIRFDLLDDAFFPRRGVFFGADIDWALKNLGSDLEYTLIKSELLAFLPVGFDTSVYANLEGGVSHGDEVPLFDQFAIGGFRSLSGFRIQELRGRHYGVARLGLSHRINFATPLWKFIRIDGFGESGQMVLSKDDVDLSDLEYSGTVSLSFKTQLGAVSLAYGTAGSGKHQFYVSVGRSFGRILDLVESH